MNYFDMRKSTEELNTSPNLEINKALRRLEEQLSLNDDSVEQMGLSYPGHEDSKNIGHAVCYQSLPQSAVMQDDLNSLMLQQCSGISHQTGALTLKKFNINKAISPLFLSVNS